MDKQTLQDLLLSAPEYYHYYISLAGDGPIVTQLQDQLYGFREIMMKIPSDKHRFRYADGKWSVQELIGHISDTERILAYRMLCIARGEEKSLPGFDEDEYVRHARFDERSWDSMVEEFDAVRRATLSLLDELQEDAWRRKGSANGKEVSVASLAFFAFGHCRHHLDVLNERYLGRQFSF